MSSFGDVLNNVHDSTNSALRVNTITGAGYNAFVLPTTLPSATTQVTNSSTTGGKFGGYALMNTNQALVYLFIYDSATQPTFNLAGCKLVVPLPYNATVGNGSMANMELSNGISFTNKMWYIFSSSLSSPAAQTSGVSGSLWVS